MDSSNIKTPEQGIAGRRKTAQRALVLDAVRSLHNHPTSAEVYQEVLRRQANISRATVYRNLDVLVSSGEILRVEIPCAPARYDATLIPHGHAECRNCGKIVDVKIPPTIDFAHQAEGIDGFIVEDAVVSFKGLCVECLEGAPGPIRSI